MNFKMLKAAMERKLGAGALDHFGDVWVEDLPIISTMVRRRICGTMIDGRSAVSVDASFQIGRNDSIEEHLNRGAEVLVMRLEEFVALNPTCAHPDS